MRSMIWLAALLVGPALAFWWGDVAQAASLNTPQAVAINVGMNIGISRLSLGGH